MKKKHLSNCSLNIDLLRSYANIMTNSTFDKIVRNNDLSYISGKIRKYKSLLSEIENLTYRDYFNHIHETLKFQYRNEYIYKNSIIDKILLGKYSLNTTTVINEFRINKSIADLVLLNGTSKVFEIKTELDKPDRLLTQINDYKRVFNEIYIVTHHTLKNKYLKLINEGVGLIILTDKFTLQTIKEAHVVGCLDSVTMMKTLRKSEYSNVIRSYYGYLPEVSDFKYFKSCMELFVKIPNEELNIQYLKELKNRSVKEKEILSSKAIPKELKYICLCLDFNKQEYMLLDRLLNRKIKLN